jgi:hypothetical protein
MVITTVEQASQAFLALMSGGGGDWSTLVPALEDAEPSVVVEAAAALLVAEAAVALGEKGWSVDDGRRATTRTGGFRGPKRATLEAALSEPHEVRALLRGGWADQSRFVFDALWMLRFLRDLPKLAPPHPPGAANDEEARLHGKVRALLAKAESTTFPAEAEACTVKAQELMERYAIDETMLAGDRPASGKATSMRVRIDAPYARPKAVLLSAVARNNRCRTVYDSGYGFSTVFGVASDLWAVDLLFTSLLVQAGVAMQQADERSRGFRHAFLLAFAYRIGERMREATATATSAATAASGGTAFLPALAAREEAAVAARDEAFPHLGRPMQVSMSNYSGASAGRQAANRASITRDSAIAGGARRLGR